MKNRIALVLTLLAAGGCSPPPEPLDLPVDPAAAGVPVGVTTVEHDGATLEVWYPAPDDVAGEPGEDADILQFVPASFSDRIGEFSLPTIPTVALRDAPLRVPEQPYPVVVFSHGMAGFRLQSVDYTTHLASRGYVVIGLDHPGRAMPDFLPCLLTDPIPDDCDLSPLLQGDDPAPPTIEAALDWVDGAAVEEDGFFAGALDAEHIGLSGHSAGGATTSELGSEDDRFDALLPMAGAREITRDVPTLILGGTCDLTFEWSRLVEVRETLPQGDLVGIAGAGHLAFSDLCALELQDFAATYLEPREDVNGALLEMLVALGTDGCAGIVPDQPPAPECDGGFLPLETSFPVIRHYGTVFFDEHLYGTGPGVVDGVFPDASLY